MEIKEWVISNKLKVEWIEEDLGLFKIGEKLFYHLLPKDIEFDTGEVKNLILDQNFQFYYSKNEDGFDEVEFLRENKVDYVVFYFGSNFYYSNPFEPQLNLFKFVGDSDEELKIDFPYLGVHGGYELGNGSRSYKDWIKKAKFVGYSTLGICEENTLAGTLAFQSTCEKEKIKSIIGETITILDNNDRYNIKLFPKDEIGWRNLLKINNYINCNEIEGVVNKYIPYEELIKYYHNIFCVLTPEIELNDEIVKKYEMFEDVFYQLDISAWSSNDRDYMWLVNLKLYFENYIDIIKPILISDAYYLDKEDAVIKKILNKVGNVGFKYQSLDQYFKSSENFYIQFSSLFKTDDERVFNIFLQSIENVKDLTEKIKFKIKTGNLFLPKYIMTEEEKQKYSSTEDLFFDLVQKGFEKKIRGKVEDESIYWERLEKEIDVISRGEFQDYFLILNEISRWCEKENIWMGLGRGSAAGSILSYILNITNLDPIKYNLIFERFLNDGRFMEQKYEKLFLTLDSGEKLEIDDDTPLKVERDGKEIYLLGSDIQEEDNILEYKF